MTTAAAAPQSVPQWTQADRLRKAREHAGMSQQVLAEATGLSRRSISAYEQGETAPRRPALLAWAFATGVPLAWLQTGDVSGDDGGVVRHQGLEPRTRWFGGRPHWVTIIHSSEWTVVDEQFALMAA